MEDMEIYLFAQALDNNSSDDWYKYTPNSIEKITKEIESYASGEGSTLGTGGMLTKIEAAKIGTAAGVFVVIGNGTKKNFILDVVRGDFEGTIFIPHNKKIHTTYLYSYLYMLALISSSDL